MNFFIKTYEPKQMLLLIVGALALVIVVILLIAGLVQLAIIHKKEMEKIKKSSNSSSESKEDIPEEQIDKQVHPTGGVINNYFINEINVNKHDEVNVQENKEEVYENAVASELIEASNDLIEDDEDEIEEVLEEENEIIKEAKSELKDIEEGIIDFNEPFSLEENDDKISTPRHMNLKLRLTNSSDKLKLRYSLIRNHLESYKIRSRFLKHKDIYYILKEVIVNEDNKNLANKTERYKIAMLTVRKKQLILSLNLDNDSSFDSLIEGKNIEINEKRYQGYSFNMKVSSEKDYRLAIKLLDKLLEKNKIIKKKAHKDVDYVTEFSEDLSTFERRGFGYLVRPMINIGESEQYKDSLAVKAIVLNKINEVAPTKSIPFEISLDKINDLFEGGTRITLDLLKEKGIANKKANKLIISDGKYLNKKFYIDADKFSTNAIKMIFLTGGEARINHRVTIIK